MTAERADEHGWVGRFVYRISNIKIVTLLGTACVMMGAGIIALTVVIGVALVNSSNQTGQISRLDTKNTVLNEKITNFGVRFNEQQRQIDELRSQLSTIGGK